jgi:hypothetical protein
MLEGGHLSQTMWVEISLCNERCALRFQEDILFQVILMAVYFCGIPMILFR